MTQDQASGAAGNEYGRRTGRGIAKLMGLRMLAPGSNEVAWENGRAVIKACRPRTATFGVTASMLPRLETILAALEDDQGQVQVWALPAAKFSAAMRDSRSNSAVGGRVKLAPKTIAAAEGRPVARFTRLEIEMAAGENP